MTVALTIAWFVAVALAIAFVCHPVRYFWDKSTPGGWCLDIMTMVIALAGANGVSDVMALVIPIPWLWKLHLPIGQRLNVIAIFLMGGL